MHNGMAERAETPRHSHDRPSKIPASTRSINGRYSALQTSHKQLLGQTAYSTDMKRLLCACTSDDLDRFSHSLFKLKARSTLGIRFAHGYTPLIVACKYGALRIVQWIVDNDRLAIGSKGKNTNGSYRLLNIFTKFFSRVDAQGNTALHHAAAAGNAQCIDVLAVYIKDLEVKNKQGSTAIHFAAYHGHKEAVKSLLACNRALVDSKDCSGKTSLMLASFRGRTQMVFLLLDRDARIDACDHLGWTALMFAAYTGRIAICRELLERGASRELVEKKHKRDAARLAAQSGYYEVVDILNGKNHEQRAPSNLEDVQMPNLNMPSDSRSKPTIQPLNPPLLLRPAVEQAFLSVPQSRHSLKSNCQILRPPPIVKLQPPLPAARQQSKPDGLGISTNKQPLSRNISLKPQIPDTALSTEKKLAAQSVQTDNGKSNRSSKDPQPLRQKANRLARRDWPGKSDTKPIETAAAKTQPEHTPIYIGPEPAIAQDTAKQPTASSISDRIKDTVSRASLSYLDSRSKKYIDRNITAKTTQLAASANKQTRRSVRKLASPYKRFHDSAWIGPYWRVLARVLTLWIPDFVLKLFRKETRGKRQAWREKLALCMIIAAITAVAAFVSFGLSLMLCRPVEPVSQHMLSSRYGANSTRRMVAIRGRLYDISNEYDADILGISEFAGQDVSGHFAPFPEEARRCSRWPSSQLAWGCIGAQHGNGPCLAKTSVWNRLRRLQTAKWVTYAWNDILKRGHSEQLLVYNENVYSLREYLAGNAYFGASATRQMQMLVGTDATLAVARSRELQQLVGCWDAQLRVGRVEGGTVGCVLTSGMQIAVTVILNTMIAIKLLCAVLFDWAFSVQLRRITKYFRGSRRVPHVLIAMTCYNESEATLRTALDAAAQSNYSRSHKLLVVVADGQSGDAEATADVLRKMVRCTRAYAALPYMAVGEGARAFNAAEVAAGTYRSSNGTVVPCIVVVKVGTQHERAREPKAGNRGKRDSQLIILQWLHSVLMNDRLTPLEAALCQAALQACAGPDQFEYLLMVDADTAVDAECVPRLVAAMERDPGIMGLCGETRVANKRDSWVTRIQVYEYYISHHLSKAFESLWGGVTCLPGCCSMYRIYARRGDARIPLLVAPDVIRAYSTAAAHTLHQKNLLLLGEDRYLTTVLLRVFPHRKLIYVPRAVCRTTVPTTFSVLVSQRRRWINSTIHNLLELVLVRDLCGTFCCSMQFLVLMDLLGNVVLPASVVFCYYLIAAACFGQPVSLPLLLMALAFILQGAMILLTTQRVSYIYWMLIYIAAIPIWNLVLPLYAFWRFDDFSWGRTRSLDTCNSEAFITDDERQALEPIPLMRWKDWMRQTS
ncbi:ATP-dependent RNA helicase [Coemansia brasiliensis]|uniref:chitin synthase n=1 Tax=Coemansia brasiliensis TaxID=2650707 RepID=A0A9W8LXE0_9FUNG|nr:ATP-dependent RNA helicase [Coemansia brasiliensis]